MRRAQILGCILLLTCICGARAAEEQTLRDGRTAVSFPPGAEPLARKVLEKAALVRGRIGDGYGVQLAEVRIRLVRGHAALQRMTPSPVPAWALAIALPRRRQIGIRIDRIGRLRNDLVGTLKHELMHLALGEVEARAGYPMPRWFNEGICEFYSGTMHHQGRGQLVFEAAAGNLIPFAELERGFPEQADRATQAYLQSHSFVSYLESRHPGCIRATLRRFAAGESVADALGEVTGRPFSALEAGWREQVTPAHPWLYLLWQGLTLFGALGLLVVAAFGLQKLRDRHQKAVWAEEDPWDTGYDEGDWRGPYDP